MNKQQKNYLATKLRSAALNAKAAYAKDKVVAHTQDASVAALIEAGFIYVNPLYGGKPDAGGWSLPLTEEMLANKAAIEKFNKKVEAEHTKAVDTVYLGSDEAALAILESFTNALKELN